LESPPENPYIHHCSYTYLGKGLLAGTVDPNRVIAVESLINHGGTGIHVLYADGHVAWLEQKEAEQLLAKLEIPNGPATRP
jgi:prepilin-type processing-associated H-X9-DG protein